MEKERSITWSHKANIQYYNILTFWAENNQSISYIESIEKQVTTILDMLISFPKIGKIFSKKKTSGKLLSCAISLYIIDSLKSTMKSLF